MRPTRILLLFPVLSSALKASVWDGAGTSLWRLKEQVFDFVNDPFRQSRVPQFILDAQHPWIIENKRTLERLSDARGFLCSAPNNSSIGGGLELPQDLFHYLEIDNNRHDIDRPGWPNALDRSLEIKDCPAALEQVRIFKIYIYVCDGKWQPLWKKALEPSEPPQQLLDAFGDVLSNMTSLETLTWIIRASDVHYFEEAFQDRGLVLPSVARLEPGAMSHFLVSLCPNLRTLETDSTWRYHEYPYGLEQRPQELLLQAAGTASRLTRFAMNAQHLGWTQELVTALADTLPGIESLGLCGSIDPHSMHSGSPTPNDMLRDRLQALHDLKNLTHLDLPPSHTLGVGFDGGAWCGNAYGGYSGWLYKRDVTRQSAEAVDRAAAIVVERLPRLQSFTIGGYHSNLTRQENGTVQAIFPWTGRMDEWIEQVVPPRDRYDEL
ncbi:hypothetical protein F5Y18DRAFT_377821 [Xylariaceae sp. FL1019]|nr:hypothetical protein F5Y18DRAFT_377821 [Xylariaceae sp. FL1019]